ncbi:MAG: PKD domain-containing protein [Flavobacteriales bacterium]|nr:PKD domain-containing protein [Flavobacteriales bacterium]
MKKIHIFIYSFLSPLLILSQSSTDSRERFNFYDVREEFYENFTGDLNERGNGLTPYRRWENYMEPRVFPTGNFDPTPLFDLYSEALNQQSTSANNFYVYNAQSSEPNWSLVGPTSAGYGIGRVNCLAFHPNNANIMFVGTPDGGVWKSTNGGESWSTNTDFLSSLGVSDIVINANNPDIMFLATGDRDGKDIYSFGLLKSTDGGDSWQTTGLQYNNSQEILVTDIALDAENDNNLLVTTSEGIFRSTNQGTSFTNVRTGDFMNVVFHPTNSDIVYAATRTNGQFWRSANNGQSWTQITSSGILTGGRRGQIAVSPHSPNTVFFAKIKNDDRNFYTIARSTDAGLNWTTHMTSNVHNSTTPNLVGSNPGSYYGQGWYDFAMAVSPWSASQIYVGGVSMYRSNDNGITWLHLNNTVNTLVDIHNIYYSPSNELFICSDMGLFKTPHPDYYGQGFDWTFLTKRVPITQFYGLGLSQTEDKILAGSQDNGLFRKSSNFFSTILAGDVMEAFIDPDNSDNCYHTHQYGALKRTYDNYGYTETSIDDISPPGNLQGNWQTPFVMDPNNSATIYAGFKELYKSTNRGDSWTTITSGQSNNNNLDEIEPTTNSNILYFSYDDKLFKTTNGGNTWSNISGALPNSHITHIVAHSENPNEVWVTFSGFNSHSVYRSTNGGSTWTNVSGDLPNIPFNCLVIDELNNHVYVGSDFGVYKGDADAITNGTYNWSHYNNNSLPNVIVYEMEIKSSNHSLYAATHGRGLWKNPLKRYPQADFEVSDLLCHLEPILFDDQSLFVPTSWNWNFGDGNTSTEQSPYHTYNIAGVYFVTLIASNALGSDTITKVISVLPTISTYTNHTSSGSYTWNGTTYFCSGIFTNHSIAANGCPHVDTLNLVINSPDNNITNVTSCDSYYWDISGQEYTTSGVYNQLVYSPQGCYVNEQLNLNITLSTSNTSTVSANTSYFWSANSQTYFCSGIYEHYSTNAAGCEHLETLILNIN